MPSHRYLEAIEYAAALHAEQRRKGTQVPYVSHLYAVSAIAVEYGADEDQAIAALLHDAVEDCGGQPILDVIQAKYGERVARIVAACSDSVTDTRQGQRKPPWTQRKRQYLEHLNQGKPGDRDYHLVSASDKLHNLLCLLRDYNAIGTELWGRFSSGRDNSLWYYRELIRAFAAASLIPAALLHHLQDAYHQWAIAVQTTEGYGLPDDYAPADD